MLRIKILLIMLAIVSCSPLGIKKNSEIYMKIDIQGHRGCRGLLPENSIPAFIKALELGVNTLELDLAVTKDKIVVISHEPWLSHEFCADLNGKRISETDEKLFKIYELTYSELQAYDCGSLQHPRFPEQKLMKVHKPAFSEMIDSVKAYCEVNNKPMPFFNIEIKRIPEYDGIFCPPVDEFCDLVLQIIKEKGIEKYANLQSFDWETLRICRKKSPKMPLAMLVENKLSPQDNLNALGFTPEIYSPYFKLIDETLLQLVKKYNMKLIPWTVNEENDIKKVLEMGVDGIITDYPDRVVKLKAKR
jgi:glycerophosphoryl diester phosphodiesterase